MILRVLIFLIATAAAGGAAWLSAQTGAHSAPTQVEVLAEARTVDVLTAGADISGGEVLAPDKLRWEPWPETTVNDRFITRRARPEAMTELAGTFVNSGFAAGEPIRETRLMAVNKNLLSNKIEPGKRAAAVRVSAESAAGGFILPGDRVDVIHTVAVAGAAGTTRNQSRIIIWNTRVLAIDQTSAQTPEGTVVGKTATLELSPTEAEHLIAAGASGMLSLALRSVADHADQATHLAEPEAARTVLIRRRGESSTVTVR